ELCRSAQFLLRLCPLNATSLGKGGRSDPSGGSGLGGYGEDTAQYMGDYSLQFGIAVVALAVATAAWIISRRKYVKSAEFKRGIETLRLEFRRSIDETRAVTARRTTAARANLLSVIKPIDRGMADLNVRLARVEEHAGTLEALVSG